MKAIKARFKERRREIRRYLDMLNFIEVTGSELLSRDREEQFSIDTTTRHVLKASVFVHLYNLIESVVKACLEQVAEEIHSNGLTYRDLSEEWQRCWVQQVAKSDELLNPEKRLNALLTMCNQLLAQETVVIKPKFSGGSLDDNRIEDLLRRHGISLSIPSKLRELIKRHVVDQNGPMKVVRLRRNELAHGLASFGDCGRDVTIRDLREWSAIVFWYLRELVTQFERHLASGEFKQRDTA